MPAFDSFQIKLLIPPIPPTFLLPNTPSALVCHYAQWLFPGVLPPKNSNIVHLTPLVLDFLLYITFYSNQNLRSLSFSPEPV